MTALKLDMQIPVGDAGSVRLLIDIGDLGQLSARQRHALADTSREFSDFAAQAMTAASEPQPAPVPQGPQVPDVLRGVTGSRIREKL